MGNRAGQLYRVAGALRLLTYLSLVGWAVITGIMAFVGALLAGGLSAGIITAFEQTTGQIVANSDTVANVLAIVAYILLLLPMLTITALHFALLGFARLLDAAGDQALLLNADYEAVPSTSGYSMWE